MRNQTKKNPDIFQSVFPYQYLFPQKNRTAEVNFIPETKFITKRSLSVSWKQFSLIFYPCLSSSEY